MGTIRYSALIRTYNSKSTLQATLDCLANQTIQPNEYVFVDSGSTDGTIDIFPQNSILHKFVGSDFNYSDSLNQGIAHVSSDYVLVISSHTLLVKRNALSFGLEVLSSSERLGAAYFSSENVGPLRYKVIDISNFDGFNGLWNTCSLIKTNLVKSRGFKSDVFSAEDQEWASWLFMSEYKAIARISGAGCVICNPRAHVLRKYRNEYVSVAYFSKRELLSWTNICRIIWTSAKPSGGFRVKSRASGLLLALRLVACHFAKPRGKSRYF